tara:strand:- start:1171 stop:2379 length:1209 start_codon:yes stop_codon:yes gene_type:complete
MYELKQNDVFQNTTIARPKYKFVLYSGSLFINDQVDNGIYETGSIRIGDLNLTPTSDLTITTNLPSGFSKYINANIVTGSAISSFTLNREFVYKVGTTYNTDYTSTNTIFKFLSLKNSIDNRRDRAPSFDFDLYFNNNGLPQSKKNEIAAGTDASKASPKQSLNLLTYDNIFYGNQISPGSITASFYKDGDIIAQATDVHKNGELVEQINATQGTGSVVGFVLYEEGAIVFTGTGSLSTDEEPYIQPTASSGTPVSDDSKWIHFGSYQKIASSGNAITGSAYELEFKGTQPKETLTMFAYAPKNELNWSNNPTYLIQSGDNSKNQYIDVTGSNIYMENENVYVKNIVSSSFSTYSASFDAVTYIRSIGVYDEDKNLIAVAKVANPVKKTTEQDYTFKLKLDL